MRFFGARFPTKITNIGAEGAFTKTLGSVSPNWRSDNSTKGGPFGSAGGRVPEKESVRNTLNPLVYATHFILYKHLE